MLNAAAVYGTRAGVRTVTVTGSQFEVDVSFAGLQQVVDPFLGHLPNLAEPQRSALRNALSLGEGPLADRLLNSNAARQLLIEAGAVSPILLVVDDLPWIDQVSAMILGFVARRLAGHRIGLLASARTGEQGFFDRTGLRTLEVRPLSDAAAADLLADRYPALTARVRQRLLAEARAIRSRCSNLPVALNVGTNPASSTLPDTLPLTRRLQTVFAGRVRDLPDPTRQVLLIAILDGSGDLRTLTAEEIADLGPAERMHLVSLDRAGVRLYFRHPLIPSPATRTTRPSSKPSTHC